MRLSPTDRISALMLAKTIDREYEMLTIKGEIEGYLLRLNKYQILSVGEIAELARMSEYKVKKIISMENRPRNRSGVRPRHFDHLIRMIGDREFAKLHYKHLMNEGVAIAAMSRVTGIPTSTFYRWEREEK